MLFFALFSPGFFDNLRGKTFAEEDLGLWNTALKQNRLFQRQTQANLGCHLLSFAGQVVHAHPDVLVVRVDLHVEELPLGVEGGVCLLKPHQLSFPTLTVPSLIPDVL